MINDAAIKSHAINGTKRMEEDAMAKVIERLQVFMKRKKKSGNAVAKELGISAAAFSQWLKGVYTGDNEKIEKAVEDYLKRESEKTAIVPGEIPFQETSIAKRVFDVAKMAHLCCDIGLCYGDAGLGKTRAVKQYAAAHQGVILIEADCGYNGKILFQEICKKIAIETKERNTHALIEMIIRKLKDSGRLIIIDEAEQLPYRALEMLRRIHDKANIGILLVGMPRLLYNLRGKQGEYAQLFSRVGVSSKLEPLRAEDVEMIVESVFDDVSGSAVKAFQKECYGNTRRLAKLTARAAMIAQLNDCEINREVISGASEMLIV